MSTPTQILFVRQHHDAKRAGVHKDYRIVIGDKAYSWASRKDFPEVGKPTILWEQPIHHAAYLNNPDIVIPDGQYGAGTQVIDYAQKGNALVQNDAYHLELNNGDRFLIKKAPDTYGEKAWLFLRKKKLEDKKNPYLEKAAALGKDKNKRDSIHGWKRAGVVVGSGTATSLAAAPLAGYLGKAAFGKKPSEGVTHADVASYIKAKNLRHVKKVEVPDMNAHYQPSGMGGIKRPFVAGTGPEALLHEYGHAHSSNTTRRKAGKIMSKVKWGGISVGQHAVKGSGALLGAYAATSDNEKARKYAPAAVGVAAAPLLVEEARATLSPAKHLWKTKGKKVAGQFLKKLGPAYGTYATATAAAVGGVSLAKYIKNKAVAKANKGS